MSPPLNLPLILEPADLHAQRANPDLLIVDLCSADKYREGHIPGAVHLNTAELILGEKPAPGQLPSPEKLAAALAAIGLTPDSHVVCYDDEGGPWAGRLIWTLDVIGHRKYSFLNGGKTAWLAEGFPLQSGEMAPQATPLRALSYDKTFIASAEDIAASLNQDNFLVWDARAHDEYTGAKALSARGGHIPGARHCEWTTLLDPARGLRLRTDLAGFLAQQGITPDKNIVTHCHTHRRSGLTYIAAKSLGYPQLRAYPGSWSEWGNRDDLPVQQGENP